MSTKQEQYPAREPDPELEQKNRQVADKLLNLADIFADKSMEYIDRKPNNGWVTEYAKAAQECAIAAAALQGKMGNPAL